MYILHVPYFRKLVQIFCEFEKFALFLVVLIFVNVNFRIINQVVC